MRRRLRRRHSLSGDDKYETRKRQHQQQQQPDQLGRWSQGCPTLLRLRFPSLPNMATGGDSPLDADLFHRLPSPNRVTVDLSPGKKGGNFDLPGGARLSVPEGQCLKKDTITMALVPPNRRAEYCPPLGPDDKLASNIYVLHAKPELRGPVSLHLACVSRALDNVVPLFRPPDGEWGPGGTANQSKDTFVLPNVLPGTFALVEEPLAEEFDVGPNGGLFNARVHHLISVRVPKRAVPVSAPCRLKIVPINEERVARARSLFPRETSDVDRLSPFYDFAFPAVEFRRPVTIRLPLPDWAMEEEGSAEAEPLMVMQRWEDQWTALETPLKFTKTTVSFDSKVLTRFCVIRPRRDRRVRVKLSMPRLESSNAVVRGDLLLFALLEAQAWHVWAECVPQQSVVEVISERVKKGFTFLKKLPIEAKPVQEEDSRFYRRNRRRPSQDDEAKRPEDLEFTNGSTFYLSLTGDLRYRVRDGPNEEAAPQDVIDNRVAVQFHELFRDNYRCVEVEPRPDLMPRVEEIFLERVAAQRAAKAPAPPTANHQSADGPANGEAGGPATENGTGDTTEGDLEREKARLEFGGTIACRAALDGETFAEFPLRVDLDDMVDYFGLQAPPEPEPEPVVAAPLPSPVPRDELEAEEEEEPMVVPPPEVKKAPVRPATTAFTRLTTSTKRPVKITKESKVLTGRSLQTLSRAVQQGLTLAVHLNLPDSVITGIGFDSLSNLQCLTDVTYKVLLHWKRTYSSRDRDRMVPDLCAALKAMGLIDMAAVVADRHRCNIELSPGCFEY